MNRNYSRKKGYRSNLMPVLLLVSIVFAVVLGVLIKQFSVSSNRYISSSLNFLNQFLVFGGELYLRLLEMVIYPIIISSIVTSLTGLMKSKNIAQMFLKFCAVCMLFLMLFSFAGLISGIVFNLGEDLNPDDQSILGKTVTQQLPDIEVAVSESVKTEFDGGKLLFLPTIVPDNIFGALVNDLRIQVILFSIILGFTIGCLKGEAGESLDKLFGGILSAFHVIVNWILCLLPFGVLCLLANQIATSGFGLLLSMFRFIFIFLLTGTALIAVNTLIIWNRSKHKLSYVVSSLLKPIIVSIATNNTFSALPSAIDVMVNKLKFYQKTSTLLVPLGMTIGRFGNIFYFSLATVFVAQLYGVQLGINHYVVIFFYSIIAGFGTAGTTGTATVGMLAFVLTPLSLPVQAVIAIFVAIDVVINPMRVLLTVHTSMTTASLIANRVDEGDGRNQARRRQPILSLKTSIVALVTVSIIITGITISSVAYRGSKRSAYYLTESIMNEVADSVSIMTTNYMRTAESTIEELRYLLETRRIDNEEDFLKILRSTLNINENLGAIYMGYPDGSFAMVKRMPDGSFSNRVIARSNNGVLVKWDHENEQYKTIYPDSVESFTEGYDPRERGWYISALEARKLIWEDVYPFASDGIPGVSCALPVYTDATDLMGVLGIDFGVLDFSYFLSDIEFSKSGRAILLNNKDEIIAMSFNQIESASITELILKRDPITDTLNLVLAEESQDNLIQTSYLTYKASLGRQDLPIFHFKESNYLTFYHKFSPNNFFHWSIGIVIPETHIMQRVYQNNVIVLVVSGLLIIISLIFAIQLVKTISRPLTQLSNEIEKVERLDLNNISQVKSRITEVFEMNSSFQKMIVGLKSFQKYVPSNLVTKLISLGKEAVVGGEKRKLTLFFSDIMNFTSLSEELSPEQLVNELVRYLSMMSSEIIKYDGTVDKYMGDGVMAFWGAPDDIEYHAVQACYAALDCQKAITHIMKKEPNSIMSQFYTRIGLHTGEVIVGNMGSSERLDYTVIGDSANLASRLEGLNKIYNTKIILSESTYYEVKDYLITRLLDKVAVKGKKKGIYIYELIAKNGELGQTKKHFIEEADKAMRLYFGKEWEKALEIFVSLLRHDSSDTPSRIMGNRCQEFLKNPPPESWDGVHIIEGK